MTLRLTGRSVYKIHVLAKKTDISLPTGLTHVLRSCPQSRTSRSCYDERCWEPLRARCTCNKSHVTNHSRGDACRQESWNSLNPDQDRRDKKSYSHRLSPASSRRSPGIGQQRPQDSHHCYIGGRAEIDHES